MLHAVIYNFKMFMYALYCTRMHNNYNDFLTVSAKSIAKTITMMVRRILQYFYIILYAKCKPREATICILRIILCMRIKVIHASPRLILTSCALGISVTRKDLIIIYRESDRKVKRKWQKMQYTR